jgi:hypothetical protein
LLPLETIDTFRETINVVIDVYGFPCELYIPKVEAIDQQETLDIYSEKPDLKDHPMNPLITNVFIEWKPDQKKLRKMGVFVEDSLPIIAWFKGITELTRQSWFKIDINKARDDWGTDEFELVDQIVKNMYNATVVQAWLIAPRRK